MLLFTLEGFTPAALSCYGSSWNRTESIDAAASIGTVWDRAVTPVTAPLAQLDRWLSCGQFPADHMVVVTDDERLSRLPSADAIGELMVIPQPGGDRVADSLEDTTLASLVAIAAEQLPDNPHVWLHSRFLTRLWDAPRDLFPIDQLDEADLAPLDAAESLELELEQQHRSDVDEPPGMPAILPHWQPPHFLRQAADDPDLVMAWMRTYGCQIRLVDALFGLLHSVAAETCHDAIVLAGTSGFALGQNGAIGHRAGPLRSCHLHVPIVAAPLHAEGRVGGSDASFSGVGIRDRDVTSADRLPAIMAAVTSEPTRSPLSPEVWAARRAPDQESVAPDDAVVTRQGQQHVAITTRDWFYATQLVTADGESSHDTQTSHDNQGPADDGRPTGHGEPDSRGHLYLKPDDLWDVNDVARLRADTANQFAETLRNA
tara:strand:- start:450 stop:1739 length:1290 start_codon:yes stop_codon:yes gene_type:complete